MAYTMAWLDYTKTTDGARFFDSVFFDNRTGSESIVTANALGELKRFAKDAFGKDIAIQPGAGNGSGYSLNILLDTEQDMPPEGYSLSVNGSVSLSSAGDTGLLYGMFRMINLIRSGKLNQGFSEVKAPDAPLRMLNHWDNMEGSIERGYSGRSFFFFRNEIIFDERTRDYARLAASVNINGIVINNVNVRGEATHLITKKHFGKLKQISDCFNGYGIKLFLSANFAAPIELGGLETSDPLDEGVRAWWKNSMAELYENLPGFGGFLIKADSEGRPGPFTYGRDHADGANMLAEAVKPYGGLIIWRCFVYNSQQDWRDRKTDRARACYDNFKPLDGRFADNVILQIKNGPMDFQVREPVSPLLGAMPNTNQMIEFQVAQEYTGHQIDLCYLLPMYKMVLNSRTYCKDSDDTVADIVCGRTYGMKSVGITAVTNTGNDENWTGHDMAACNLYGYGRMCYDLSLTPEEIAREWIALTYGENEKVAETVYNMLITSWDTYEKYTVPLGIGWMVSPLGGHYGPFVEGYEYSRWGTYNHADLHGLGVDRTMNGTGYTGQYNKPLSEIYDDPSTCPEELLLFFHHMRYDHVLSSGKTILQHIYDVHFEGAEKVEGYLEAWKSLKGLVGDKQYEHTLNRFERQLFIAREWRDQVNTYFFRRTGIGDAHGRKIYL